MHLKQLKKEYLVSNCEFKSGCRSGGYRDSGPYLDNAVKYDNNLYFMWKRERTKTIFR